MYTGGIINAEPTPSRSEYPTTIRPRLREHGHRGPGPVADQPGGEALVRPQMSDSVLPGIINDAMVKREQGHGRLQTRTLVSRSMAMVPMATVMLVAA